MDIAQLQQQATEYLARGQYNDAVALYQQCIDRHPTETSNYWYLGLALLLQGEELEAQAVWLSALAQLTPLEVETCLADLIQVLETQALRYLQLSEPQLAEKLYGQILELDSARAEAHYNLGIAISYRGDYDAAIACWQRTTELKPDFVDAYYDRGCVLQKLEQFSEAISCYLKALEIQPERTEIHYHLGICLFRIDKLDEAIACFQKAIQLQPDYTPAYGEWGAALLEQGKLEEAIACFHQTIRLKPAFAQAYFNWSQALASTGERDRINDRACFLKALQIELNSAEVYFYLGKILAEKNKPIEAIAAYNKALPIKPDLNKIYFDLGKILVQQGKLVEAIAAYKKALNGGGDLAQLYLYLAKALAQQNNIIEAVIFYQKSLEINPGLTEVYFELGNTLVSSGKLNEAIACYQQYLNIQPNSANVCCNLGIAFAQLDNSEEAIACFQQVLEINPNLAGTIYNVMMSLVHQGRLNAANADFQKVLPVDPPKSFYNSTLEWAVTCNLDRTNYINIYSQNRIYLKLPKTADNTVHFSFRFGSQIDLPATFVAIVPDGRYWLDSEQIQTAIITSDNKLLADISPDYPILSPDHPDKHPSNHSIFSVEKLPPARNINGAVAVLSGLSNDIYFHWMFDVLPRIQLLRSSGIQIADIDYFLINTRKFLPFHQETLAALEIPETKRLENYNYPHIKAEKLIVPSFPGSPAWMPKWSCDFLRHVFIPRRVMKEPEKIERIYISRGSVTSRRILNEDEVISVLHKFGFKSIILEAMSVAEQARLMASAKVVVAPHGSGLTNLVFCSPGTKVIEIFSPNYVYPCYWLVSNLVGLEYFYILGETLNSVYFHQLIYPNSKVEDIFVDINSLLKIMKFAEAI
jgi:tetratricopeptide (TPR) repeat protein